MRSLVEPLKFEAPTAVCVELLQHKGFSFGNV
jgi:hypothetical protein